MNELVKVELTELADLVERKLALEETVRDLSHRLKHDWQLTHHISEEDERLRRRKAIQEIKDSYLSRIRDAEVYAEAPIEDKRTVALNGLAAAMSELAIVRRLMKAFL